MVSILLDDHLNDYTMDCIKTWMGMTNFTRAN
jgi:hypothetical protein